MTSGSTSTDATRGLEEDDAPRQLGRYLLLRRIARGGMGEVMLATTMGLEGAERPVVVKVIRREHAKDPSFIARFLDEARVQAQLQHSGVAQVIDAAIDDVSGDPYAVVEHVEGRSLGDVRARALQAGQAIGWADAVAIATLIAEALAHVHERLDPSGRALAIVHRDLSPQNVMVSYHGDCKIIDFGTARGQNRRCHTVAGVVFAKPGYVAPEVANGDTGDARVDVYALGIMLWELCAGRRFLQGDATAHMTAVARNAKNPPPIAHACGAPVELDGIIAKLTSFDRDERYLSARAAAADLAPLLIAADELPSGERGVRARTAHLMKVLFPAEPGKTRREFARLVAAARDRQAFDVQAGVIPAPAPSAPEAPRAPSEGEMLAGTRYRIVRELGRGSSSVVYEAEHADLGRRVALKILGSDQASTAAKAERFRREARFLSRLSHEGLVAVHDVAETADGRPFCVMELLEGQSLESYLAPTEKGIDWRDALTIAGRALDGLACAHAAGLVHRDVKPGNVFVQGQTSSGFRGLKILDFGLARGLDEKEDRETGMALFGTPEYMAPEQAGSGAVDARADIYSIGCVLYEMLTGQLPFGGSSSVAILDAKAKGSPERPRDRAFGKEIPESVDALVMKALSRHPSLRFQTAAEMKAAVSASLAEPALRRSSRKRIGLAGFAVVAALAGVVMAGRLPAVRSRIPWLNRSHAPVVTAEQAPVSAPTAAPDAPAQEAVADADGFDAGDDGDLVDDTAAPAAPAPADAQAAVAPTAAPSADPAAAPAEAPKGKHKKGEKLAAKAKRLKHDAVPADPAADGADKPKASAKAEKARKKRHARTAKADLGEN